MCGRYSFTGKKKTKEFKDELNLNDPRQIKISFNIAPTQLAYIITNEDPNQLSLFHWGLLPSWSTENRLTGKMINARKESIFEKPSFKQAILKRRCLIPADSFYEWRKEGSSRKPFRILRKDGEFLVFAGIWERNQQSGAVINTFSIITCDANKDVAELHNRMPVVLYDKHQQQKWISDTDDRSEIEKILKQPESGILKMYGISKAVNTPSYDMPDIHDPVPDTLTLF